ncbi:MAG: glycoside hydrolase family 3 C-terminal domain-containing protein [Ruminococcus sp.]|nr:glycoside hydrolase family 3 C-terminal domain-containing protein [Ruminococcus sp.]
MNIDVIMKELTLEEKASLCSGSDYWHTEPIDRLDIPAIMVSDGPHGLRKNSDDAQGPNEAIKAVCFPSGCATACSFDRELLTTMGKALGQACKAEKVSVLLGPGCNIKRSPLCGRNFEYFSEDPFLASEIAAAHIKGVQSMGVGTSLKHFCCNNQETRRMSCSANMDERTFFEIYAAAFETAVKEAKPYTLMCSYNKLNDVFCSENKFTLTEVLRDKWGYKGLVMSDWGAVNNRPLGVQAGLDLEMPTSYGANDKLIVESVKNGTLDEKDLDKVVRRVLELVEKTDMSNAAAEEWDMESQHELARRIACECAVLLKNENSILPLDKNKKIAFIGAFAKDPRYQGGGSSHINSFKVTNALDASAEYCKVDYAQGYENNSDEINEQLMNEAVSCAEKNDIVVIFAGLTDLYESEGFDRAHMKMPENQLVLIDKICQVNKNVVIVLHNGSPVEMPFADKASAILEMYLGGQAVGGAACDLLFGKANPSGKLAETFPKKLSDNPSYLNFPGFRDDVDYREGIFVGYRYYDLKEMEPLFPFGHGLSYTQFEYSDMKLSQSAINAGDELTVSVNITNTGSVEGKEVVQLYVSDIKSSVVRPLRELKGFEKVSLKPGETKKVVFKLNKRSFAFYSDKAHDWIVEEGDFAISLGSSSRDIRTTCEVFVSSADRIPIVLTENSTFGDLVSIPEGKEKIQPLFNKISEYMSGDQEDETMGSSTKQMVESMLWYMPLRGVMTFADENVMSHEELEQLIAEINEEIGNK